MTKDLALLVHGSSKYVILLSFPSFFFMNSSPSTVLFSLHLSSLYYYPEFLLIDISLNCRVTRADYLNTEEFIDAVAAELQSRLAAN